MRGGTKKSPVQFTGLKVRKLYQPTFFIRGSRASRKPSPTKLRQSKGEDGQTWYGNSPMGNPDKGPGRRDHAAPFRRRRLRFHPQETQACSRQNSACQRQSCHNYNGVQSWAECAGKSSVHPMIQWLLQRSHNPVPEWSNRRTHQASERWIYEMPMAMITLSKPGPKAATIAKAKRKPGRAMRISTNRMMMLSNRPP